eukprot:c19438_g1_i1.p1 GENE.c19438_g1_i1~~c19438_g1_i1.p1  ORF type:complete len:391 (+),score=88.50 c19438_g1_i1:146-1174(+)
MIDEHMKREGEADSCRLRLLLLGTGEAGKSTIFKQVNILHGSVNNTLTDVERRTAYIRDVHQNVVVNMRILIEACRPEVLDTELPQELQEHATEVVRQLQMQQCVALTPELAGRIEKLWRSAAIQAAFKHKTKLQLADNVMYFFESLDRVSNAEYLPTNEDILRVRVRTTGVNRSVFTADGAEFEIIDVGGQRSERRRWIHQFDKVQAVIFVAALNDYELKLYEDVRINRMTEALNLFQEICNSRFFCGLSSMILFLNKCDLFKQRIKEANITSAFPDYTGPQEYEPALDFIKAQFESLNEDPKRPVHVHVTCALDTNNLGRTLSAVRQSLLRQVLDASGLL